MELMTVFTISSLSWANWQQPTPSQSICLRSTAEKNLKAAGTKHRHELRKPTMEISEWMCKYLSGCANIWVDVQISEWMYKYLSGCANIWVDVQISEWMCKCYASYAALAFYLYILPEWHIRIRVAVRHRPHDILLLHPLLLLLLCP